MLRRVAICFFSLLIHFKSLYKSFAGYVKARKKGSEVEGRYQMLDNGYLIPGGK
jgi:hypothetical protein